MPKSLTGFGGDSTRASLEIDRTAHMSLLSLGHSIRILHVAMFASLTLAACASSPSRPTSNCEASSSINANSNSSQVEIRDGETHSSRSPAAALNCERLFEVHGPRVVLPNKSSLGSRSSILKIANFNVLNLAIQVGKFERDSRGNLRPVADPNATGPNLKAEWALNEIRRQVNDESPDILVLQEIESRPALEIFRNTLLTKYEIIQVPGNDTRGIDVAVLVKQGLPFEVRAQSHRAHQHDYMGEPSLLYSRDLLTLSFHEYGRREALFVLAATHNKSQRSTSLDPDSNIKRGAQVEGALRLLEQPEQPRAKIYMGDLNADVRTAPEFAPLKQAGYREGMEILDVPAADRVTHHFFKSGNSPPESSQLDAIFFSPVWSEARAVRRSRIVPHRDRLGHLLDRPRTKDERKRQASDHNMYWVEVNLEALRRHLDAPAQPRSEPQPRPQAP